MVKQTVGITGASGFIGQKLVERLAKTRVKYRIVDRNKSIKDQVKGCTAVIHLAAVTNSSNPDIQSINVDYTRSIIRELSPKCILIFTSSFAVYKTPGKGEVITEDYPTDPRNRYGQTKLEAEKLIKQSGLNAWILRLSNVYGPDMPPFKHSVVATFSELIKQGKELTIDGDGSQTRDFTNVDDVVSAMMLCLEQKPQGAQILNICSGVDTSLNDLVKIIGRELNEKPKVKYNTAADITTAGFWKGDWQLAKQLLGWKPKIHI